MKVWLKMAHRSAPSSGTSEEVARVDERHALCAVADGNASADRAGVAHAVDVVVEYLALQGAPEGFARAFSEASDALVAMGPERTGAALAVAAVDELQIHVAHVGDVRVYLVRGPGGALPEPASPRLAPVVQLDDGTTMCCLTRDHTSVADMVERGHLSPEQAREHPLRGRMRRSLGAGMRHEPEVRSLEHRPGDRLVLCSDGVWGEVADVEIAAIVAGAKDAREACEALADAALDQDGLGDVTVAVVDLAEDEAAAQSRRGNDAKKKGKRKASPTKKTDEDGKGEALLAELGRDLSELAQLRRLDPVIGRASEIRRLAQALVSRRKANALLVGPAGVGKTAIVEGLAMQIAEDGIAPRLADKRIVELTMSALVAGTKYRGEFEERMRLLVKTAEEDPDLVLFIDEFHTVMGAGDSKGGSGDAAQILKPALARGALSVIGATTTAEYQRYIAQDAAFERRFAVIDVAEATDEETIAILEGLRDRFEEHYGLGIDSDAFVAAVQLSKRYIPSRHLPDKAIDLVDQACARKLIPLEGDPGDRVERGDVVALVAERCGVDVELVGTDLGETRERVGRLRDYLASRVFGQQQAVEVVSGLLEKAYGGLKEPTRPVASFLFLGPTGVGKTETAKVLAEFLFGDRDRLLRVDMSEYQEKHSVARLVGSPPGYVGHDDEGQLTGPMARNGQRVILFDEIEKAHPNVLLILLQLLDEGTLTDSKGRPASFRESVIVLTSNLLVDVGARAKRVGFRLSDEEQDEAPADPRDDDAIRKQLESHLRPELIGRIGAVVSFDALTEAAAERIVAKTTEQMIARLHAQGASVTVPDDFVTRIMGRLDSLAFGARAVERLVADELGRLVDAPVSVAPASVRSAGDARHKAIVLGIRTKEKSPEGTRALDELAARLRLADVASAIRFVDAGPGRLLIGVSDLSAAIQLAREADGHVRAIHRGRVQLDDAGHPRGVTLGVVELVLEALDDLDDAPLVVTGAAKQEVSVGTSLSPVELPEDDAVVLAVVGLWRVD